MYRYGKQEAVLIRTTCDVFCHVLLVRRDWLQLPATILLMNILVQAQKYANEPATRCNSFIAAFILFYCRRPHMSAINAAILIAAFILFYFTCVAGLTSSAERLRCLWSLITFYSSDWTYDKSVRNLSNRNIKEMPIINLVNDVQLLYCKHSLGNLRSTLVPGYEYLSGETEFSTSIAVSRSLFLSIVRRSVYDRNWSGQAVYQNSFRWSKISHVFTIRLHLFLNFKALHS